MPVEKTIVCNDCGTIISSGKLLKHAVKDMITAGGGKRDGEYYCADHIEVID